MKTFIQPTADSWFELAKRPVNNTSGDVFASVQTILDRIKAEGDKAVVDFNTKFDGYSNASLEVSKQEIEAAETQLSTELKAAIELAAANIITFHKAQKAAEIVVETMPGVVCRQKMVAIDKVGLYIPGGTAPLFSTVLMLAIPAAIAGCSEVVLCTPPSANGSIHPAILFAAKLTGVHRVFKIGGVQAIGAMAYGTETVPAVYKIFGPGNQYVTAAKQLVSLRTVAIDMPAGPSEVLVMADEQADASFVAADLLAQAEHGATSQVILVTSSELLAQRAYDETMRILATLPRREMAEKAIENSRIIVLKNDEEMMAFSNLYAPEHLIINTENADELAEKATNAGSIFIGALTPESAGDYASGTNHTLPTDGFARMYSGVNLDAYCKKITLQKLTAQGIKSIGPAIEIMAENEQLDAHKLAVTLRLQKLNA